VKASMYFHYTTRSLWRGGQRTLLAIFCVAVGVMAIVALQLVGLMLNNAFTSNVRTANGGDIAVTSPNQPFTKSDLSYFKQLKQKGTISDYTAVIDAQGTIQLANKLRQSFTIRVVDAANYPVVTPPTLIQPKNATLSTLLKHKQVIATSSFVEQYHKKPSQSFDLHATSRNQGGRTIHVTLAGVAAETGILAQAGSLLLISTQDYQAAAPSLPMLYDTVYVTTTSQAQTNKAVSAIQAHFPIATLQTATDALKAQQSSVNSIRKFLELAGLLALLIGGVGIVNTMQVLLSRRKAEIAMLKTTGYRRFDLYLLFGLETGLLGLIGGIIGATAAIAVCYVIRNLVQQTFGLHIPFMLDPTTIAGGILIGLLTALIFGLLPIAQAAMIRPLNVIRDMPESHKVASLGLTIGLLLLLSMLFCGLAIFILNNDVMLGLLSVYGTFTFLGLLSLFFGGVILIMSKFPVPEHFSIGYLALVLLGVACSALLFLVLPSFGGLLLVVSLLCIVIILLPRPWKATIKMALRNLDRQRARTTTTMLALFVGIFTIGLILVLGQDLRDNINSALARTMNYNVLVITSNKDTDTLHKKLNAIAGLSAYQEHTLVTTIPVAVNKKPFLTLLPTGDKAKPSTTSLGRDGTFYFLSGIEGYNVSSKQVPSTQSIQIISGRNLNARDAKTNNILIPVQLARLDPLHLKLGDTITLTDIDRQHPQTVTVVGIYQQTGTSSILYPLLGTTHTVSSLQPTNLSQSIFYMKIDPKSLSKAVDVIGNTVPNSFVLNQANIGDIINQMLSNILLTLIAIASLSLLAGIIIIANAVALAMLERRRELGILKSVGYTSGSILSEVLIENALIGGTGALLAMLLVTLATNILGTYVFKSSFGVSSPIALALILGSAALAMLIAWLVSWGAVRVRPLEVLRYE
jgi:putative ABC transport system permease protein